MPSRTPIFLLACLSTCLSTTVLFGGCDGCDFFGNTSTDAGPMGGGIGDACMLDTHCRMGLVCDGSGMCAPSGTVLEGGPCQLTGDCMNGLYCSQRRTCEAAGTGGDGGDCNDTSGCEPGLLCVIEGFGFRCRPSGDVDLGGTCASELDCVAGLSCVIGTSGARVCNDPMSQAGVDGGTPLPPIPGFWTGEVCETDDGPPTAYFQVPRGDETDGDFYRLPFPNDVRRTATGLDLSGHPRPDTALSVDVLGRHITAAEQDLNGFSTNPVIYFRYSRPFEWDDVTPERMWLVDITPGSPDFGNNLGRSWFNTFGPITKYICNDWMAVRRGHGAPLRGGTTYAAFLTNGIRTSEAEGHMPFARAPDLAALLSDSAPTGDPLLSAHTRYQVFRDWLAMTDTPAAADVLNAAVFTTQDATAMIPALRTAIRAETAPTISDVTVCGDGITSPCDDGELRVCGPTNADYHEIHARISLPQFQQGDPPFEEPEDGGNIATGAGGIPIVQRQEDVCMVITVPKVAVAPALGFPVFFYAHGTGGAFTSVLGNGLAREMATGDGGGGAPQAVTVAIDMPLHGARRGGSTRGSDSLVFNFVNPRAARDNHLQGSADLMSLLYWAQTFILPAASAPTPFDVTFDATRFVMWGHSQGATHSMLLIPFEPALSAALISGGGGDLTQSLLTKTMPVDIARAVPLALLDFDSAGNLPTGDKHPALALFQMFYEAVDPVNYGRHYFREPIMDDGRHVFMTYGVGDSFTTEATQGAFALSAQLPIVAPELVDVGLADPVPAPIRLNVMVGAAADLYTVGVRQYTPDAGDDGHFVSTQTTMGRADTTRFVLQALNGEPPTIGR